MRSTRPSRQAARASISPPGASSLMTVSGSVIARMPVSSSTVATQIAFEPDIGGVCSGSMMIQAASASGCLGGTSRLTWRKTPPRGSFSTKSRKVPSSGDPARLRPERLARRRRDAADDHIADLALGVATDDVDEFRGPHLPANILAKGRFQVVQGRIVGEVRTKEAREISPHPV